LRNLETEPHFARWWGENARNFTRSDILLTTYVGAKFDEKRKILKEYFHEKSAKIKGENAKSGADEWKTIEATVFERGKKIEKMPKEKKVG
jgi:hypothetical protein